MQKENMYAICDKVIVRKLEETEEKTEGGIIVPENVDKYPQGYGEVYSVGNEAAERASIEVGDILIYHKHGGQEMIVSDQPFKCLGISEVYGVIKQDK